MSNSRPVPYFEHLTSHVATSQTHSWQHTVSSIYSWPHKICRRLWTIPVLYHTRQDTHQEGYKRVKFITCICTSYSSWTSLLRLTFTAAKISGKYGRMFCLTTRMILPNCWKMNCKQNREGIYTSQWAATLHSRHSANTAKETTSKRWIHSLALTAALPSSKRKPVNEKHLLTTMQNSRSHSTKEVSISKHSQAKVAKNNNNSSMDDEPGVNNTSEVQSCIPNPQKDEVHSNSFCRTNAGNRLNSRSYNQPTSRE